MPPLPRHRGTPQEEDSTLSDQDIGLLYEIITRAERKPDVKRLPFRALFAAYDEILAEHGAEADNYQVCMRFLFFKMGAKVDLRGQSLYDRFEDVLREMGIVLDLDATQYEDSQSVTQHRSREEGQKSVVLDYTAPRTEDTSHRTRRRRASFNSIYDVGEDVTQKSAYRPSSRASLSQLEVGKSEFPAIEKPSAGKSPHNEPVKLWDRNELLAQWVEMGRRLMGGLDPLKEIPNMPQEAPISGEGIRHLSVSDAINGNLTRSSSLPSHARSSSGSSRKSDESSIEINSSGATENMNLLNDMALRPSLSDLLRDASTFSMYRRRALARKMIVQWQEKAIRLQQRHRDMEAVACNKDKATLLRQGFDLWRAHVWKSRQKVQTEHFFKHLERRAARARDLYLMTKAFTHWAQLTSDEVAKISAARQHVLRLKYFNAWQEITAVNELKAQRFTVKRPLDSWKKKIQQIRDADATAVAVCTANLKGKFLGTWFWELYYVRRAPEWNDYRLKRRTLISWIRALRTQRERDTEIDHQNRHRLLKCAFETWLQRARILESAEREADSKFRKKILNNDLENFRARARLTLANNRVVDITGRRIKKTALEHWILRVKAVQQARQFDQLRVMRNAWTAWNDRLRCGALQTQIEDRLKIEVVYKWVLAERFRLMQRIRDQRIVRETFAAFITNTRTISIQLMQREEQYSFHRDRDLLRSKLSHWREQLALQRRREYIASEFYIPRVEQEALIIWTSKCQHIRKLEKWAQDARFYFLMTGVIKQWHAATANLSKKRRQEAYVKVRRMVKMNLASSILRCLQDKAEHLAELEQRGEQIRRDKLLKLASDLFHRWHEKAAKRTQDSHDADVYYHRQLAYHLLTRWIESTRKQLILEEQAVALDSLHVSGVAAAQLRKLSLRVFQVRSTYETADAMHGRILRKHLRIMLWHWIEKTRSQLEARGNAGPSMPEANGVLFSPVHEPATPGLDVIPESEPTLNFSALISLPDRQATPVATPGYLNSPSKRAARARMLAQMSTTPATPLYTPFASRLRAAIVTDKASSIRDPSRRSSVGTTVRFVDEEPESPSEGRRSTRRE